MPAAGVGAGGYGQTKVCSHIVKRIRRLIKSVTSLRYMQVWLILSLLSSGGEHFFSIYLPGIKITLDDGSRNSTQIYMVLRKALELRMELMTLKNPSLEVEI